MVELVGDDSVLCTQNGFEQPCIGVKAGCVQDRVFHAEEVRDALFECLVNALGTANESYGSQAETPGV